MASEIISNDVKRFPKENTVSMARTIDELTKHSTNIFRPTDDAGRKFLPKNPEDPRSNPTFLEMAWRRVQVIVNARWFFLGIMRLFCRGLIGRLWFRAKQLKFLKPPKTNLQTMEVRGKAGGNFSNPLSTSDSLDIANVTNGYLSCDDSIFDKVRQLGRGCFGEVWLIKSRSNGEYLVCKEILISGNRQNREFLLKSFEREYSLLKMADHANIVRFISFQSPHPADNIARVYMEYCEGGDLSEFIENFSEGENPRAQETIWKIIFQLAAALAYLHHGFILDKVNCFHVKKRWRAVLHRDIKPNNVLLSNRSGGEICVKLCDFGIGKLYLPGRNGTYVCTRQYKAPEITRDDPNWSLKADIYSLGRTIQDLSMGRGFQTINEIVRKCLSKAPETRPSSLDILETAEHELNAITGTRAAVGIAGDGCSVGGWKDYTFSAIVGVGSIEAPAGADQDGPVERLQLLMEDGCDLNMIAKGPTGNTPLHVATETGNYLLAQRLLLLGANANALNRYHQTALSLAIERDDKAFIELLQASNATS